MIDGDSSRRRLIPHLLVALAYSVVALWAMRVVWPAPATTLPLPADLIGSEWRNVQISDQEMVVFQIARNARAILNNPSALFDSEQCYPMAHATTLGEHMFGSGLLGVLPYLLTHDAILTYNLVVVLTLWLGAMGMYVLAFYWTRTVGAAFVAGLLFGFHPLRVGDPAHPFVVAYQWIPIALVCTHRLFARERWRDAAGLAVAIALQLLESFYAVLALVLIGGVYGLSLMVRHVRRLPALALKLFAVGVASSGVAVVVFHPYLQTRATWGVLQARQSLLNDVSSFGFGGVAYPGSLMLVLGMLGVIDRIRNRRWMRADDPRAALLIAAALTLWASVWFIPIPFTTVSVPSLFFLVSRLIPGMDAVRAGGCLRLGVVLVAALLAAYGVAWLTAHCRRWIGILTVAVIAAGALVEIFWTPVTSASFDRSTALEPWVARPDRDLLDLYADAIEGPVLDLPFRFDSFEMILDFMGHCLFLGAFHEYPLAACYNSFLTPVQSAMERLAAEVPAAGAAEALYALGFRAVVVHEEVLKSSSLYPHDERLRSVERPGPRLHGRGRFVRIGRSGTHVVYRIEDDRPVASDFAMLATSEPPPVVAEVGPPLDNIELDFRNGAEVMYRHPEPLALTALQMVWTDAAGTTTLTSPISLLLPLALPPGSRDRQRFLTPIPPTFGEYQVTVAPVARPDLIIARRAVRVRPPPPPESNTP
ncbi:MAG: hypothetical protein HYR72_14085 [Deltaproteobacteria bacterium]|nr:hypothetical protein [Deltaproteobacteria bacterium]MBI3391474.1 hypothetical protein [Deltaproteobacteria bacterium]